jgi:hypothetical protein
LQERFEDIDALRVRNSFFFGQLRGGNRTPPAIKGFSASVARAEHDTTQRRETDRLYAQHIRKMLIVHKLPSSAHRWL